MKYVFTKKELKNSGAIDYGMVMAIGADLYFKIGHDKYCFSTEKESKEDNKTQCKSLESSLAVA